MVRNGRDGRDERNKNGGSREALIPKHGAYRKLKSFQVAQLAYDVTVRFCNRYIGRRSRTHDQMVQAARSGVQNIAEGSIASGTSKKTELKLTNAARASLEELRLDYEDFLRQRDLPLWAPDDPRRQALVARRCTTADEVAWCLIKARTSSAPFRGRDSRGYPRSTQPNRLNWHRAGVKTLRFRVRSQDLTIEPISKPSPGRSADLQLSKFEI
jgi:four helix bundle protein